MCIYIYIHKVKVTDFKGKISYLVRGAVWYKLAELHLWVSVYTLKLVKIGNRCNQRTEEDILKCFHWCWGVLFLLLAVTTT